MTVPINMSPRAGELGELGGSEVDALEEQALSRVKKGIVREAQKECSNAFQNLGALQVGIFESYQFGKGYDARTEIWSDSSDGKMKLRTTVELTAVCRPGSLLGPASLLQGAMNILGRTPSESPSVSNLRGAPERRETTGVGPSGSPAGKSKGAQ